MTVFEYWDQPKNVASWQTVTEFENKIAEFFGAPYAVSTDSCTSAIELCLRLQKSKILSCPKNTYLSIPMLADKLGLYLHWYEHKWQQFYVVDQNIIDAATMWGANLYQTLTLTCISFQHQKHLSLGRGGMILTDNKEAAIQLKKMSYDGRLPGVPWREQDIDTMGYHYYMTPETAALGLQKLPAAIATEPKIWDSSMYPDLTQMKIFKK